MNIVNKKLTPEGFIDYIERIKLPFWRKIDKLVFHHTSKSEDLWQGSKSMLHYYDLYKSRGWKAGPHIFIAPDGIWIFTPIKKGGHHAGKEGDKNSIGIEIVGRYNDGPPTSDTLKKYIALVTSVLMEKFDIPVERIYNHTQFVQYTFCSPHLTAEWINENRNEQAGFVELKAADYEASRHPKGATYEIRSS